MKRLFKVFAIFVAFQGLSSAQEFESMKNMSPPAPRTQDSVIHQQNDPTSDESKTCKCTPINCKPLKKGLEYTGRGAGGVLVGAGGFVGGFVVGLGYFAYRIFPIKCGCEGKYGVDIRIEPFAPFYFAGKGAYYGFKACWK